MAETITGVRRENPLGVVPGNGEYGRDADGHWFGMTPDGHLANLSNHSVTEHEDGTITVAPSIKVSLPSGAELWHGFLERGVWRKV